MRNATKIMLLMAVFAITTLQVTDAEAQRQRSRGAWDRPDGPLEFSVAYGSMWGGHLDGPAGTFRVDTGDSWYFAANLPIRYGMWGELSYTRQGTRINLDKFAGTTNLTDMTVHVWQIGAIQGLPRGNFIPYVTGSMGLTYFSPKASSVDIGPLTYRVDSATKFSVAFGVGIKAAMGPNQRVGFRAQFRVIPTILDSSTGIWFGTGGGGVAVSGSGIWQYEASAGLVIKLGR